MATKKTEDKIPVSNFDQVAVALKKKLAFFKMLEEEVEAGKTALRNAVNDLIWHKKVAVGSRRFSFVDTKGLPIINVTLPDVESVASRKEISPEKLTELLASLESLKPEDFEVEESFVLTGPWAVWLKGMRKQWEEGGIQMPEEGIEHKTVMRARVSGVAKLISLAQDGVVAAQEAITSLVKAATILPTK